MYLLVVVYDGVCMCSKNFVSEFLCFIVIEMPIYATEKSRSRRFTLKGAEITHKLFSTKIKFIGR